MKVCIFGAKAIGGYRDVLLAKSGVEVSLVARGPHLAAMRQNGVWLLYNGTETVAHPVCTNDPTELGIQDYVIVGLKAHQLTAAIDAMQPLPGNDTAIVTAVNGVSYGYFHHYGGALHGRTVESVDPGGLQWHGLGPERTIGCIVYPATEVVEPGVIQHIYGKKFPLGEPSGERTPRVEALAAAFTAAGLDAPVLDLGRFAASAVLLAIMASLVMFLPQRAGGHPGQQEQFP